MVLNAITQIVPLSTHKDNKATDNKATDKILKIQNNAVME